MKHSSKTTVGIRITSISGNLGKLVVIKKMLANNFYYYSTFPCYIFIEL